MAPGWDSLGGCEQFGVGLAKAEVPHLFPLAGFGRESWFCPAPPVLGKEGNFQPVPSPGGVSGSGTTGKGAYAPRVGWRGASFNMPPPPDSVTRGCRRGSPPPRPSLSHVCDRPCPPWTRSVSLRFSEVESDGRRPWPTSLPAEGPPHPRRVLLPALPHPPLCLSGRVCGRSGAGDPSCLLLPTHWGLRPLPDGPLGGT